MENENVKFWEKISFGLGDTASNLFFQSFMLFLLYFYTDVFGISAAAAGTLFLLTRVWDSANDPLMGIIADRTTTRWGKFRPYLLWMAVPFGIIGVLTFTTPDLSLGGKVIYAYITYTLMMMVYTAINIPYSALMGVVSSDPLVRTSFSQYRFVFAFIGAFIVQGLMLTMVENFGGNDQSVVTASVEQNQVQLIEQGTGTTKLVIEAKTNGNDPKIKKITIAVHNKEVYAAADTTTEIVLLAEGFGSHSLKLGDYFPDIIGDTRFTIKLINEQKGFQWAMTVFAVLAVIMFLITFKFTKERVSPSAGQRTSLKNDLKDLLQNKPWIVLFFLGIFTLSYVSIRNGSIMYYFKYYVGNEMLASGFMVAGTVATIAGILLTGWISRLFGKKKAYIGCMALASVFTIAFYFVGKDDIVLMYVLQIIINFIIGPTAPLVFAMYTDAADYSEWKTGRRATGLVMSASTMAQKFGWTIGGALAGWLLAVFGFKANVTQGADTMLGIRLMMSWIPAAGSVLAALFMLFYRLDESFMQKIETELTQRRVEN